MGKIGRNEQCLCGSGKKFKHCCLLKQQAGLAPRSPERVFRISLDHEIHLVQKAAAEKKQKVRELGVFILFSTTAGDAWVLEITDSDAVQVARGGVALEAPIDQNPETIEVNWSHTFTLDNREFAIKSYADRSVQVLAEYPTQEINAAMKRIRKRFSPELLEKIHVQPDQAASSSS